MNALDPEEPLVHLRTLAGEWTNWESLRLAALADLELFRLGWKALHDLFKLDLFSDLLHRFADVRVMFVVP